MDLAICITIGVAGAAVYAICLFGGLAILRRRAVQGVTRIEQR